MQKNKFLALILSLNAVSDHAMQEPKQIDQKSLNAPLIKQIQETKIFAPAIQNAWQALYESYLYANGHNPTATNPTAIEILFQTNFFNILSAQLAPNTFPQFLNDPDGTVHFNYATVHLKNATDRFAHINTLAMTNSTPTITSSGDSRDLGIIVNIANNSGAIFTLYEKSIDGTSSTPIATINAGNNGVDLHTASLQNPTSTSSIPSSRYFELIEQGATNPVLTTLKMMKGSEFLTFLTTLYRTPEAIKKNTFEMNGLPTSPQYLVNPDDFYLVLCQNPTPKTATERDPNQRIQAINLSVFDKPYLLSMQINAENIKIKPEDQEPTLIYQPSITTVQTMANQTMQESLKSPLLILPDFLDKNITLSTLQNIINTLLLYTQTMGTLFNHDNFANQFSYFNNLSCFNNQNRYSYFIDLYNRHQGNYTIYNASWLISDALYETNLNYCSDIPQIYTAQDPATNIIVNEKKFYYTNFLVMLIPNVSQSNTQQLFNTNGFNQAFQDPFNQLYSFIISALKDDIKEGIFGAITQITPGVFTLEWSNKKNKIFNKQTLYLNNQPSNIEITFLNQTANWVGSSLPSNLLPTTIGQTNHFKVTYEYSPDNDKHILLTQTTSPIDKQEVFLPLEFSTYPIQNLYMDLFETFNVVPFTRYSIIKNGILPDAIANATKEDWQNGIYLVPLIKNQELILLFYNAQKKHLGNFIPNAITSLKKDISNYNIYINNTQTGLMDLYLSTGIFLKKT